MSTMQSADLRQHSSHMFKPTHGNPVRLSSHPASNAEYQLGSMVSRLVDTVETALSADQCMMVLRNKYTYAVYSNRNGRGSGIRETEVVDPGQDVLSVLETNQPRTIEKGPESIGANCPHAKLRWLLLPLSADGAVTGVLAIARRDTSDPFDSGNCETARVLADTAGIAIENTRLRQRIEQGYISTMLVLAGAIDAKDPYTQGHSRRVARYAVATGLALKFAEATLQTLEQAAVLHDVGKIGISDSILSKCAALTSHERSTIEDHPVIGAAIVRRVPFLVDTVSVVLHHHERYDGKGYPHGLAGADIPLGARIVAVADSFDTMTTDRPYRRALTVNEAMLELHHKRGSQFCPEATDAFAAGFSLHRDAIERQSLLFEEYDAADIHGHLTGPCSDTTIRESCESESSERTTSNPVTPGALLF